MCFAGGGGFEQFALIHTVFYPENYSVLLTGRGVDAGPIKAPHNVDMYV